MGTRTDERKRNGQSCRCLFKSSYATWWHRPAKRLCWKADILLAPAEKIALKTLAERICRKVVPHCGRVALKDLVWKRIGKQELNRGTYEIAQEILYTELRFAQLLSRITFRTYLQAGFVHTHPQSSLFFIYQLPSWYRGISIAVFSVLCHTNVLQKRQSPWDLCNTPAQQVLLISRLVSCLLSDPFTMCHVNFTSFECLEVSCGTKPTRTLQNLGIITFQLQSWSRETFSKNFLEVEKLWDMGLQVHDAGLVEIQVSNRIRH